MGWFNVSNLLSALAPAVQWFPQPGASGVWLPWDAFGVAQAIALVSGAIGENPLVAVLARILDLVCGLGGVGCAFGLGLGRVSPGRRLGDPYKPVMRQ